MQEAGASPAANSVLRNGIQDEFPGERGGTEWRREAGRHAQATHSTSEYLYNDDIVCRYFPGTYKANSLKSGIGGKIKL
jgi:hypothetical protein